MLTLYVSDIPYTAALTKVDTICPATKEDIRDVFKSKAVAKVAQALYELLNLDIKYMLPVEVNNLMKAVDQVLMICTCCAAKAVYIGCNVAVFQNPTLINFA